MSLFVGFIHKLMWQKIGFMEDLTSQIAIDKSEIDRIATIEKGDLEDLIDESNIHGWLEKRVIKAEKRLAKAVSSYIKANGENALLCEFYNLGKDNNFSGTVQDAYKFMTESFLDGMPCDGSLKVLRNDNEVHFEVVNDVHRDIWEEFSSIDTYWKLREAYMKGLVEDKLSYEMDGNIHKIRG